MNNKTSSAMRILRDEELDQVVGGACRTVTPPAPKKPAAPAPAHHHHHHHVMPAPAPLKPIAPVAPWKPGDVTPAAPGKVCG